MSDDTYKKNVHMPAILSVKPLENHRLLIMLGSGSILTLNMENRLHTVRYSPLKDLQVFQSVSTDGETLFFGKVLRIGAKELMEMALTPLPGRKERNQDEQGE